MEKIVAENLFLLEFLVDKCIVLPSAICDPIQRLAGETCVSFKFLDNGPLDVCEEDFKPGRNLLDDCPSNTRSGKSCLFALSAEQAENALKEFNVEVSVFKKLCNGMLPEKIQIGIAVISIVELFTEVIQLVENNDSEKPDTVSRTLKDNFNIFNNNNEVIGDVSVFIRMSCFGKVIVTQFQMNLEDKSVFFKDKEGKSLYKYRKAGKPDTCTTGKSTTPSSCKQTSQNSEALEGRCQECSPEFTGRNENYGDFNTSALQPYQAAQPPCMQHQQHQSSLSEKGTYQEIGAEMNGNAITIRVHKDTGVAKRIDENENNSLNCGDMYKNDTPCLCSGMQSQQQNVPCSCLNQNVNQSGPCTCLKNSGYGNNMNNNNNNPCANKQMLTLRPGDDPNNPFAFRVSGCPNNVNNNVTVVSPCATRPDGMQVTEISDPSRDVFVLRIGKKSEGTDKKANLELELVTPKGVERKPIPKKCTRETQYNPADAGPAPAGGKNGNGKKGGKGGKKKK